MTRRLIDMLIQRQERYTEENRERETNTPTVCSMQFEIQMLFFLTDKHKKDARK